MGLGRVPTEEAAQRWKGHAKEYLAIRDARQSHLGSNTIPVNYDDWTRDKGYRDKLLHTVFGIDENHDVGINDVPKNGRGSSHDGRRFQGRASEMTTDRRWETVIYDPLFQKIIQDPELAYLSTEIFGRTQVSKILGTRISQEGRYARSRSEII